MKLRAEINKIEKRTIKKVNKTKSWIFEKINKIGILLDKSSRKKRRDK